MTTKTKILIVEHDPSDLELLKYELSKSGINYVSEIVENEKDYGRALKNFIPDIILSDFSLPAFDGPTALKLREAMAPDTPFIFVSGTIGEENSIEYIKNGVTDYALKDKLFTLTTKVKRALKESKEKQLKTLAEQVLIKSERRLARAQKVAHMGSWELDFATNIFLCSEEACRIYGLPANQNQLPFKTWLSYIHPGDLDFVSKKVKESQDSLRNFSFCHRIITRNELTRHIYTESKLEFNANGKPIGFYGITQDITDVRLVEEQMEFDRNNIKALINNTGDLMWSVDRDFKLIIANQPFHEQVRLLSGKAISKGTNILLAEFPQEYLIRYKNYYERAFKSETFTVIEYREIPLECWAEISFAPISKQDEIIGAACHSRDITAYKLAELERTKITNDLIQRNKDLEQFTYIVSHNLRAPVANIIGIAEAMYSMELNLKEQQQMTENLNISVKRLDNVIKDLGQILQIREMSEQREMVRFSDLLRDIRLSIDGIIRKESARFIIDFSEVDEMVTVKSYLYSIFTNLISNSVKYRQPGISPIIEITTAKSDHTTEFFYKDNGLGIDLEKRGDQVFGLYKRFHSHIKGKGVGLFMVKTQVEALGGKIAIQSKVNEGTAFRIIFEA